MVINKCKNILIANNYIKGIFEIQDNFINMSIPFNQEVMKNHGTINGTINEGLTVSESMVINIRISNPASTINSRQPVFQREQ